MPLHVTTKFPPAPIATDGGAPAAAPYWFGANSVPKAPFASNVAPQTSPAAEGAAFDDQDTTNKQDFPSAAADSVGNFVVVWASYQQDGSNAGVYGQRYSSA
ncbi:MAG TPA: hypothetical protein VKF32_15345, partial [Thermoanaerobaculia bacterium]|nr:hypothetical protein [Thermoanaerobaculia bacterium]